MSSLVMPSVMVRSSSALARQMRIYRRFACPPAGPKSATFQRGGIAGSAGPSASLKLVWLSARRGCSWRGSRSNWLASISYSSASLSSSSRAGSAGDSQDASRRHLAALSLFRMASMEPLIAGSSPCCLDPDQPVSQPHRKERRFGARVTASRFLCADRSRPQFRDLFGEPHAGRDDPATLLKRFFPG